MLYKLKYFQDIYMLEIGIGNRNCETGDNGRLSVDIGKVFVYIIAYTVCNILVVNICDIANLS